MEDVFCLNTLTGGSNACFRPILRISAYTGTTARALEEFHNRLFSDIFSCIIFWLKALAFLKKFTLFYPLLKKTFGNLSFPGYLLILKAGWSMPFIQRVFFDQSAISPLFFHNTAHPVLLLYLPEVGATPPDSTPPPSQWCSLSKFLYDTNFFLTSATWGAQAQFYLDII